jgi:hypothetical protein
MTTLQSVCLWTGFFAISSYVLEYYMVKIRRKPFALGTVVKWNNTLVGVLNGIYFTAFLMHLLNIVRIADDEVFFKVYYLSKIYEFLDVVLVTLSHNSYAVSPHFRFHHITTLSVAWASFYHVPVEAKILIYLPILTNVLHHFFMYLYFGGVQQFRKLMPITGTVQLVTGLVCITAMLIEKRGFSETVYAETYILTMYITYMLCWLNDLKNSK